MTYRRMVRIPPEMNIKEPKGNDLFLALYEKFKTRIGSVILRYWDERRETRANEMKFSLRWKRGTFVGWVHLVCSQPASGAMTFHCHHSINLTILPVNHNFISKSPSIKQKHLQTCCSPGKGSSDILSRFAWKGLALRGQQPAISESPAAESYRISPAQTSRITQLFLLTPEAWSL